MPHFLVRHPAINLLVVYIIIVIYSAQAYYPDCSTGSHTIKGTDSTITNVPPAGPGEYSHFPGCCCTIVVKVLPFSRKETKLKSTHYNW